MTTQINRREFFKRLATVAAIAAVPTVVVANIPEVTAPKITTRLATPEHVESLGKYEFLIVDYTIEHRLEAMHALLHLRAWKAMATLDADVRLVLSPSDIKTQLPESLRHLMQKFAAAQPVTISWDDNDFFIDDIPISVVNLDYHYRPIEWSSF